MEFRRFPRDCALDLRVSVAATIFRTTSVVVTLRLPVLGGVEVRGSLPDSSRLRARVRWEVALAVVPHHNSDTLIVLRAGFLDATTGATPIVWTSHPPTTRADASSPNAKRPPPWWERASWSCGEATRAARRAARRV